MSLVNTNDCSYYNSNGIINIKDLALDNIKVDKKNI